MKTWLFLLAAVLCAGCSNGGTAPTLPKGSGTIPAGSITVTPGTLNTTPDGKVKVSVADTAAYTGQYNIQDMGGTIPGDCIVIIPGSASSPNSLTVETGTADADSTESCPVGGSESYNVIDSLGHSGSLTVTIVAGV